jgi:two-component system, NtrC family, response regulator PilR
MRPGIVVISAEPDHWKRLSGVISGCGFRPVWCETLALAKEFLAHHDFRLALCDDVLPDGNFRQLVSLVRNSPLPQMPVIVVSRIDDWGCFLQAMVAGAFDYVAFPPYPHELERALAAALAGTPMSERVALTAAA